MKKLLSGFLRTSFIATICAFSFHAAIAQSWTYIPGIAAQDIAVGKNGSVWAIAKNGSIYNWNGSSWETISGGASRNGAQRASPGNHGKQLLTKRGRALPMNALKFTKQHSIRNGIMSATKIIHHHQKSSLCKKNNRFLSRFLLAPC